MRVLIVGGGKVGSHLAHLLLEDGYEVMVVEQRPHVLSRLHRELPTEVILDGDGTQLKTLELAGIRETDVLVTVTGDDETNLTVAMLGRKLYHVPRIIGRINNPKNAWLFTPEMGVDVALNQADLLAKMIAEQMSLGDMMTLLRLREGKMALVTEKVEAGAPAVGKAVRDLEIPRDCLLVSILRHDEIIVPRGDTILQAEDEVLALVRAGKQQALHRLLSRPTDGE